MRHTRAEVIVRTIREFELLDALVSGLSDNDWQLLTPRPMAKDPWTIKDAVVHIVYWKADTARFARGLRIRAPGVRRLSSIEHNHLIWQQWRERSTQDVVAWHRSVQQDVLEALRDAPDDWFSGRERKAYWPIDLDGHSATHRVRDIQRVLGCTRRTPAGHVLDGSGDLLGGAASKASASIHPGP